MWTSITRQQHSRECLRYGSDLTDAEWAIIAPLLPPPKKTGRPRRWPMRDMMNAVFYVLRSGCAWRMVPDSFAPRSTVYRWFVRLRDDGVFETMNHHLLMRDRERMGRQTSPSAAVLDSQSVKTTEAGGPRGYDAGKKVKGRKRHALVDTDGRALVLQAHAASIQDRDGAVPLLKASRKAFPFIELAFADSAYAADSVANATCMAVEIVPRCGAKTRAGTPCRRIGNARNHRCILHGGRAGAPPGERNGRWRHGNQTKEAKAQRRAIRDLLREADKFLRDKTGAISPSS